MYSLSFAFRDKSISASLVNSSFFNWALSEITKIKEKKNPMNKDNPEIIFPLSDSSFN
jgi:hypothetical protein